MIGNSARFLDLKPNKMIGSNVDGFFLGDPFQPSKKEQ